MSILKISVGFKDSFYLFLVSSVLFDHISYDIYFLKDSETDQF